MEYIEYDNDVERIYSINYNQSELEQLLDEIVKNTSYKEKGWFQVPVNSKVDFKSNLLISGGTLPNGDQMFEEVKKIKKDSFFEDMIGCPAIIKGTCIQVPRLAYIIRGILDGNLINLKYLDGYSMHNDLLELNDRIDYALNLLENDYKLNFFDKLNLIYELKKLMKAKKNNEWYDVSLLNEYYQRAKLLIDTKIISERSFGQNIKILN